MRETTDTRFKITTAGTHQMTATKPCIKKMSKSDSPKPYYEFYFEFMNDGKLESHLEILFPNQAGMLLRALQCKEVEPGVFDWDKEEIIGRKIVAEIAHIPDRKDKTKLRASIVKAEPVPEEAVPF